MISTLLETKENTPLPPQYKRVLDLIPHGKFITVKEIITVTGMTDYRIRSIIADLVTKHNYPIGSSIDGYFIIETEEERTMAIGNLTSRIYHLAARVRSLKGLPDKEQMSIDELLAKVKNDLR